MCCSSALAHTRALPSRIAETLSEEILAKMHAPAKPAYPVLAPADLANFDAFLFGVPTRYGNFPGQWKAFWDATGQLWASGALMGKYASVFVSTASPGGGQESTVLATMSTFAHHGIIFVPLGYGKAFAQLTNLTEVRGGESMSIRALHSIPVPCVPPESLRSRSQSGPSEGPICIARGCGLDYSAVLSHPKYHTDATPHRLPLGCGHLRWPRRLSPALRARARGRRDPGQALLGYRQQGQVLSERGRPLALTSVSEVPHAWDALARVDM